MFDYQRVIEKSASFASMTAIHHLARDGQQSFYQHKPEYQPWITVQNQPVVSLHGGLLCFHWMCNTVCLF